MRLTKNLQELTGAVPENVSNDEEEQKNGNSLWWWSPSQSSLAVDFCNETSIHGFKFIGQDKRHLSERIFWLIGFCCSLALAIYLIYGLWDRYQKVPVIVTFRSSEQDMDSIPFPAVTLCNMNKFPRKKVEELQKIAESSLATLFAKKKAKRELVYIRNFCNSQQSFAKDMGYAYHRGTRKRRNKFARWMQSLQPIDNDTIITDDNQIEMTNFLIQETIQCSELIRLCMLGEMVKNCSDIFKPVITDYGKCCTFNILPLPLLTKNPKTANITNASLYNNPLLGSLGAEYWPEDELNEWQKWNYDEGIILKKGSSKPWRQKRAGLPYGLSILVDPNVEQYYCPASDSVGIRYILHAPLEMPRVMEFSSVMHMGKEILVEVHPDVTNADDDIRNVEQERRMCYFGKEKSLRFLAPYTSGNCVDECMATLLQKRCNCSLFYLPSDDGIRICDSDPDSKDIECTELARLEMQENLKELCSECNVLCEDVTYNYETTTAELQNGTNLWGDPNPTESPNGPPYWMNHKMSIVHIFFGEESTVPKFRKRLYGITDLIANTGGILGLCLGFSILSAIEVIYFLTLRSFWKYCRKRLLKRKQRKQKEQLESDAFFAQMLFQKPNNKVVQIDQNVIPVYPNDSGMVTMARQQSIYASKRIGIPPTYINGIKCGFGVQNNYYGVGDITHGMIKCTPHMSGFNY